MILIFGRNGQVGTELQRLSNVISYDRNQVDLKNAPKCAQLIKSLKPDTVINAAAYTDVDKAESDLKTAIQINSHAPYAMSQACAEIGVPFIHLSTDYVFSGNGQNPWKPNDITIPKNYYGQSKLEGEKAVQESGANYAIIRTSGVISAHGQNFVKTMIKLAEKQKRISVVNDQILGPTPAKNIAATCMSIASELKQNPQKSGIYHFCGNPAISWYDFTRSIFGFSGQDIQVKSVLTEDYPMTAMRPLNCVLDCSLTYKTFGISQPSWRIGLQDILKELEVIK